MNGDSKVGATTSASSVWTEYTTPEGKKYYFNRDTKQTSWDKPDELKSPEERAMAACPWKEYVTQGRKYYYNTITKQSEWEMPLEYKQALEVAKKAQDAPTTTTPSTTSTEQPPGIQETEDQANIRIFKELLISAGVKSTWTWDTALKEIKDDERYKLIKPVAEKKQLFLDFTSELRRTERERAVAKEKKAKEDFVQLLSEFEQIGPHTNYRRMLSLLEKDARFQAVENEYEREDLFDDYVWRIEKQKIEDIKAQRRVNMTKLLELFVNTPSIIVRTHWKDIKERFKDDPLWKSMERIDRLTVFEDYIKDLEKKEMEEQRAERERMRRTHRKNRDAFKELIVDQYNAEAFTIRTRWKEFLPKIREHPALVAMIGQPGSLPSELYMDFIEEKEDIFDKDRSKMKGILKTNSITVTPTSDFESFKEVILTNGKDLIREQTNIKLYFDELQEKAVLQQRAEEKKKKKAIDQLLQILKRMKSLTNESKWEDIKEVLASERVLSSIEGLLSEDEKTSIFNEHVVTLVPKEVAMEISTEKPETESKDQTTTTNTTDNASLDKKKDEEEEGALQDTLAEKEADKKRSSRSSYHDDKKKHRKHKHHRKRDSSSSGSDRESSRSSRHHSKRKRSGSPGSDDERRRKRDKERKDKRKR